MKARFLLMHLAANAVAYALSMMAMMVAFFLVILLLLGMGAQSNDLDNPASLWCIAFVIAMILLLFPPFLIKITLRAFGNFQVFYWKAILTNMLTLVLSYLILISLGDISLTVLHICLLVLIPILVSVLSGLALYHWEKIPDAKTLE